MAQPVVRQTPAIVGVVVLAAVLAYWESWASLFQVWNVRPGYSHGYLVVIVAAALLLHHRKRLAAQLPRPALPMLGPLIAVSLLWIVMVFASVQVAHQLLVPVLTWIALYAVCGRRIACQLLVPLAYVVTAVPLWDIANPTLQSMTVAAIEGLLGAVGISSYIESNIVTLPNGVFEIAGGCSGLHFFVVGLSTSVLYAHLYTRGAVRFALVVAAGIAFAILANWVRVFVVIVAGYLTDMQHFLVTVDHYYFGWLVFALGLIPFTYVAKKIERARGLPDIRLWRAATPGGVISGTALAIAVGAVAATMFAVRLYTAVKLYSPADASMAIQLPEQRNEWRRVAAPIDDWVPVYHGPAAESSVTYENDGRELNVYANVYSSQGQGRELIGYDNRIEGDGRWRLGSSNVSAQPDSREVVLVDRGGNRRIVVFWYDVGGKRVSGDVEAKWRYASLRLVAEPLAGIVAVSARCRTACDDERRLISAWIGGGEELTLDHIATRTGGAERARVQRAGDTLCRSRGAGKSVNIHESPGQAFESALSLCESSARRRVAGGTSVVRRGVYG